MATTKQLIERWENVLRVLRALTPHERKKHFDMQHWGIETECGTVCCAVGHCTRDTWFRRRGLGVTFTTPLGHPGGVFDKGWPLEYDRSGWLRRLETFFGADGVYAIFQNSEPRSVGQVIKEVRAHIKSLQFSADSERSR